MNGRRRPAVRRIKGGHFVLEDIQRLHVEIHGLIEQDVARPTAWQVAKVLLNLVFMDRLNEKCVQCLCMQIFFPPYDTYRNNVIVKKDPLIVALDDRHIVSMVRATPNVYHTRPEFIKSIRVIGIITLDPCQLNQFHLLVLWAYRVEQSQLKWENDAVGQLDILLELFLVFKPLQMKRQDVGQLLDLHPSLGFLQATTDIAEIFVLVAKRFASRELAKAGCDGGVHFDVDG